MIEALFTETSAIMSVSRVGGTAVVATLISYYFVTTSTSKYQEDWQYHIVFRGSKMREFKELERLLVFCNKNLEDYICIVQRRSQEGKLRPFQKENLIFRKLNSEELKECSALIEEVTTTEGWL